jgi:hypothetical protein
MMNTHTQDIPFVVDPDEMTDDNFIAHFEHRHGDQLPNLEGFAHTIYLQPELIETYRKFHDRLHSLMTPSMMEEPHEHEAP